MPIIDLTHDFANGMPGFSLKRDGEVRQFTAQIRPFVTHEDSAPLQRLRAETWIRPGVSFCGQCHSEAIFTAIVALRVGLPFVPCVR